MPDENEELWNEAMALLLRWQTRPKDAAVVPVFCPPNTAPAWTLALLQLVVVSLSVRFLPMMANSQRSSSSFRAMPASILKKESSQKSSRRPRLVRCFETNWFSLVSARTMPPPIGIS